MDRCDDAVKAAIGHDLAERSGRFHLSDRMADDREELGLPIDLYMYTHAFLPSACDPTLVRSFSSSTKT
jgi:hypothetical protein